MLKSLILSVVLSALVLLGGVATAENSFNISGNVCDSGAIYSGCSPISGVTMTLSTGGTTTTAINGNYSSTVSSGWSGTVTPSKSGWSFTPASKSYTNVTTNQYQNYTGSMVYLYISGYVRASDGTAISHAVMTLSTGGTATTDSSGKYSFTLSSGWSGTVTPSKSGYTFTPTNKSYTNLSADQADQNYSGSTPPYTIAGNVCEPGIFFSCSSVSGVTMTLSTGGITSTDSDGNYSFTVSPGWSGTVTPSKIGYTSFTPTSESYSNVTATQHNQNYRGSTWVYISGYVKASDSTAISPVTITLSTGSYITTDSSGHYSVSVSYGWSGTVTQSKSGYTFTPTSKSYTNVTADQADQNYTGSTIPYTIAGNVWDLSGFFGTRGSISGVTMTLSTGGTTTTDSSGNYSFTVSAGWSGTVTSSKSGYTFTPTSKSYTNVTATQHNQDYMATESTASPGDVNGSGGTPDLTDAILALQILAGLNPSNVFVSADVNSNNKIGLEEVIYILQKVSGLRP